MRVRRVKALCDFERVTAGIQAGASVTKTATVLSGSMGTMTKLTSAFRSIGNTSVNTLSD